MSVRHLDETMRSATHKVEKVIESFPAWLQWLVLGVSVGILLTELFAFIQPTQ